MKRILTAPAAISDETFTISCGRDKSLTHRAIMFASLAQGHSVIREPLLGADCLSTLSCFEALGVKIDIRGPKSVHVESEGFAYFRQPQSDLDCGNSGTTARLILGILAAHPGLECRLIGDESLSKRPMKRVVAPLRKMGAHIEGPDDGNFLPLTVRGQPLTPVFHSIDKASAQIKSCLMLAGMFSEGTTSISLPKGSRDHTECVLKAIRADLTIRIDEEMEHLTLKGPVTPLCLNVAIPVDPSSAAFFAVLGLLRSKGSIKMPEVLDNPTRTGFLRVLSRMSSGITFLPAESRGFAEPIGTLTAEGGLPLRGTDIQTLEVPSLIDEIPILAVAAAFAKGPSLFRGLSELRVKESDRLILTEELLKAAGCNCEIRGDDLWIAGSVDEAEAFTFDPRGDHRLAMAAAILSRRCKKPCCILDSECVRVSFPNFYEALDAVNSF